MMKQQYFNDSNDDQWYEGNEKVLIGWCKKEEGGGGRWKKQTGSQYIGWVTKKHFHFSSVEKSAARVPNQNDFRVELK